MSNSLSSQIEALLFHTGEPMDITELADACDVDADRVHEALAALESELEDRGLTLVRSDSSVQLRTGDQFADLIKQFRENRINTDLTSAQSEALAVIAYIQPVSKPDIDFIRGVNSRTVLRNLQTRGLINKQQQNKKTHYKLTTDALAHLGISKASELPQYEKTQNKLTEFISAAEDEGAEEDKES